MTIPLDRTEKILFDAFGYTINREGRELIAAKFTDLLKRKILSNQKIIEKDLNLNKLSESQISSLKALIEKTQYGSEIKNSFINNFNSGVNYLVFNEGVKIINNFTILLRANSHISSDTLLANKIMASVTRWAWDPNGSFNNDLDSLAYAIKNDINLNTIKDAVSDNKEKRDLARTVLEAYKEKNQLNERQSYVVEGIAAVTVMATMAFGGYNTDFSSAPGLIENIYNSFAAEVGLEPIKSSVLALSTALATTASLYFGARIISKTSTWVAKIYKSFCFAMSVSSIYKSHDRRVADMLTDNYLYLGFGYNVESKSNLKDIISLAFMSEKLINNYLKIKIEDFELFGVEVDKNEIDFLNSLTKDNIVQISNITNPTFQKALISKIWTDSETALIKNIDSWDYITTKGVYGDKKYYYKGKPFSDYIEIPSIHDFATHKLVKKLLLRDELIDMLKEIKLIEQNLIKLPTDSKQFSNFKTLEFSLTDNVKTFIAHNSNLNLSFSNTLLDKLEKEKILISSFLIAATCGNKVLTGELLNTIDETLDSSNFSASLNSLTLKQIKGSVNKTKQVKVWGVMRKLVDTVRKQESYNNVNPNIRNKIVEISESLNFSNAKKRCLEKGASGINPIYKVSDMLFKLRSKN